MPDNSVSQFEKELDQRYKYLHLELNDIRKKMHDSWEKEKKDIDVLSRAAALGVVAVVVSMVALSVSVVALVLSL